MTVLNSLAREHRLFLRLLERLERAMRYGEKTGREEIRGGLLVLLQALERHERIEDAVFSRPAFASARAARPLLEEVNAGHRRIENLKSRAEAALAGAEVESLARLGPVILNLAAELRSHFSLEETKLWPLYQHTHGRSLEHSMASRARKEVLEVIRSLQVESVMRPESASALKPPKTME